MSIQEALLFINSVRRDDALRSALRDQVDDVNLDALIDVAHTQGLKCTEDDFRRAFRLDWAMRALHSKRKRSASAERQSDSTRLSAL
jgi:hypothetical protein